MSAKISGNLKKWCSNCLLLGLAKWVECRLDALDVGAGDWHHKVMLPMLVRELSRTSHEMEMLGESLWLDVFYMQQGISPFPTIEVVTHSLREMEGLVFNSRLYGFVVKELSRQG